jgi:phosphoribosylaminoimidazole-succinocarboxamide synthase
LFEEFKRADMEICTGWIQRYARHRRVKACKANFAESRRERSVKSTRAEPLKWELVARGGAGGSGREREREREGIHIGVVVVAAAVDCSVC